MDHVQVGPMNTLRWAGLHRAMPGETVCGDIVATVPVVAATPPGHWLVVIDGLGHGQAAAQAAQAALSALEAAADRPELAGQPDQVLRRMDKALTGTRGAAIGLAWITAGALRHAGIGNTRTLRWRAGRTLRLPSSYGIVGDGRLNADHLVQPIPVQDLDLQAGDALLMFTDGLNECLSIGVMLPEWTRDPARLCQHLMAQGLPARDDTAVLAAHILPGVLP
jgi:serine/threonine protein phosphatase PrpC